MWQPSRWKPPPLPMMIAPQGSNLFLDVGPVIAMGLAAAAATAAVLGRSPDEPELSESVPVRVVPPVVDERELGSPVASLQ